MLVSIVAFIAGAALDLLWVRCVSAVQEKRPVAAANISVLLYLCTLVSTVLIVNQCILACIAFAAGSWIGAYLGVKK
jgi:uncharacterized protein YebE (UPF0316 family)